MKDKMSGHDEVVARVLEQNRSIEHSKNRTSTQKIVDIYARDYPPEVTAEVVEYITNELGLRIASDVVFIKQ